jgi:hypothetical protein
MKRILILVFISVATASFAQTTSSLDTFMEQWHLAASKADYSAYFGAMAENFVFLGTAPGERWNKQQFSAFSKPYFDKGKAWDFKASNRTWDFSPNGKVAWFDEELDTWMRGCRGSGVLVKKRGQWKLVQYNLTVLIENEKIKPFIELRDQPN